MSDPRLLAYLRQYAGTYSESALRQRLSGAGYTPEEIDEAFSDLAAERPPESGATPQAPGIEVMPEGSVPPPAPYWRGADWAGPNPPDSGPQRPRYPGQGRPDDSESGEPPWSVPRPAAGEPRWAPLDRDKPKDEPKPGDVPAPIAFLLYFVFLFVAWALSPDLILYYVLGALIVWALALVLDLRGLARGVGIGLIVFPVAWLVVGTLFVLLLWGLCVAGVIRPTFG